MGPPSKQLRRRSLRRRLHVRAATLLTALLVGGLTPAWAQSLVAPPVADAPRPAQGYRVTDAGVLTIEHMGVSQAGAQRLAAIYVRSASAVEESLGIPVPERPHAILAPNDAHFLRRFEQVAGRPPPGLVLAVAFPQRGLILVRESGIQEGTQASLEATLRHELVHLALGPVEQRRGQRLPKWLNEGLSEWASGRRLTPQEQNLVAGWSRAGQLPLLDDLETRFPAHDNGMARAYTISLAFLSWLEERHGEGTLKTLVAELVAGARLDQAFERATGAEVAVDLEPDWHASLAADHSVFEGLVYGFNVWALTALLALLAIARHVLKNRRLKREMALAELAEDELAEDELDEDELDEDEPLLADPEPPEDA